MPFDQQKLPFFPTLPGVYLMKGKQGKVLYIGKAKNLRNRVKQYFLGGDGRAMIPHLVMRIEEIDTIVVRSEKEALLLENTLIKSHQPKYNALLKDDKTYISLKINIKHRWPMLQLVRYKGKPKSDGLYFGPYTNAYAARQTLDFLNKIFPLRQCSDREILRRDRPCILYGIGKCCAPCVDFVTKEDYDRHVAHVIQFLRGQDQELLSLLHQEMAKASERLEFEAAGKILQVIRSIERTIEAHTVIKAGGKDLDVYGLYRQEGDVFLTQMVYRAGKLVGAEHFDFGTNLQEDGELLESFLFQFYQDKESLPHEILLPTSFETMELLGELLSSGKRRATHILSPQKGEKASLVAVAQQNAASVFKKEKDEASLREKTLLEMQEKLHLSHFPKRIECFDNSNISGSEPVASLVAFTEGKKDSKRYRYFNIKTVTGPDDYASMREILRRRYKRAKEENDLPDLIIVDGGKGQLNAAYQILEELNLTTCDLIGLAKEGGRHDKGMTSEQIFLLGRKDPILLPKNSSILFLLQNIRDEAHRVALNFHRKRRSKKMIVSAIDQIPGIGEVKKSRLLRHFGSMKRLKMADESQLSDVKGLTKKDIQNIQHYFLKGSIVNPNGK